MQFNVEVKNVQAFRDALAKSALVTTGVLQQAILNVGSILKTNTVPPNVPYKTGQLVETFFEHVEGLTVVWGPTVNYAAAVEFGTKPHVILPKNKKALYWAGAKHPVKRINHPGSAPNPYMERIITASQPEIDATFEEALQAIIKQITP